MAHDAHAADAGFNELDPHGSNAFHEDHHHVNSWQLLLGILLLLLFFTALTVFTAQGEQWIMDTFNVTIPHWVNIAGALTIATIKAVLVCAYFMQLKNDKALNTIVLLFCLLCVGLFLAFSMIDLGNRDRVNDFKGPYAQAGGTGVGLELSKQSGVPARLGPSVTTNGLSLPQFHYEAKLAKAESEEAFWVTYYKKTYLTPGKTPHRHPRDAANHFAAFQHKYADELAAKGLIDAHHAAHETSDANRSRPRVGLSGALDTHEGTHDDGHHAEDADHHAGDHDATPDAEPESAPPASTP